MTHVIGTLTNLAGMAIRMQVADIRVPPTFLLFENRVFRVCPQWLIPASQDAPILADYEEMPAHYVVDVSHRDFEILPQEAAA